MGLRVSRPKWEECLPSSCRLLTRCELAISIGEFADPDFTIPFILSIGIVGNKRFVLTLTERGTCFHRYFSDVLRLGFASSDALKKRIEAESLKAQFVDRETILMPPVRGLFDRGVGFYEIEMSVAFAAEVAAIRESGSRDVFDHNAFHRATRELKVCVYGLMNCGKSSLLNLMLGVDGVCPVSGQAWTCCIWRIRHGDRWQAIINSEEPNGGKKIDLEVQEGGRTISDQSKQDLQNVIRDLRSDQIGLSVEVVTITCNLEMLRGIEFVDLPGLGEKNEEVDRLVNREILSSDVILFVTRGDETGFSEAARQSLTDLQSAFADQWRGQREGKLCEVEIRAMKSMLARRLLVVVNKADLYIHEDCREIVQKIDRISEERATRRRGRRRGGGGFRRVVVDTITRWVPNALFSRDDRLSRHTQLIARIARELQTEFFNDAGFDESRVLLCCSSPEALARFPSRYYRRMGLRLRNAVFAELLSRIA